MARKKAAAAAQVAEHIEQAAAPVEVAPALVQSPTRDEYDELAEQREERRQAVATTARLPQQPPRAYIPDPIDLETTILTDRNDGPKMRLYRSNRNQELAIQFDERPANEHLQKLHDGGFDWNRAEKVWTKPITQEAKWRDHADAEKVFREISTAIRAENGLGAATTQEVGF